MVTQGDFKGENRMFYKNVAFIPVRGGSKSIPLKNIKPIAGKPLVLWTVEAAAKCEDIDKVYVSTDSDKIREVVNSYNGFGKDKVEVISRSAETANDTASTESAMLEFANNYDFENIVLVQATSPLLTSDNIKKGFEKYKDFDSIISLVEQKRFIWKESEDGSVNSVNYDFNNRPRRQEFNGYLVENGAFYITSKERLLSSKNRISGKIGAVIMDEETYFEIDEPSDWIIIENLLKAKNK